MTTIRYFVPEDGDTEDHPNIFLLNKSTNSGFSPKLREIKDNFPLPGNYHFRFKSPLIPGSDREKNAISVWMDCINDDQHVGVWKNTVVAKVTRISMDDDYNDPDFQRHAPRAVNGQNSNANNNPMPSRTNNNDRSATQHMQKHQPTPTPVPTVANQQQASANLLGLDDKPMTSSNNINSAPASGGSLLDVDNHPATTGSLLDMNGSYNTNLQNTSNHDDFLGMTSTPVATTTAPVPAPSSNHVPPSPSPYGMQKPKHNVFDGPFGGLNWE